MPGRVTAFCFCIAYVNRIYVSSIILRRFFVSVSIKANQFVDSVHDENCELFQTGKSRLIIRQFDRLLADRTNVRAHATVLRLSVVRNVRVYICD